MEIKFKLVTIIPILVAFTLFFSHSHSQNLSPLVPALYVFGDSIVDGGNNRPNHPYGVDLDAEISPRATNGLNIADYIAMCLELPLVPPYSNSTSLNSTTGINFAFGGSAVQPQTHLASWNFDGQIRKFEKTVFDNLSHVFGKEIEKHLQQSIFLVSYPINDYMNYIDYPSTSGKALLLDPILFSKYLLDSFAERLTTLYLAGARKFVVTNIWPLGCMPYYNNYLHTCNERVNDLVKIYNNSLPDVLNDLASDLDGFEYAYSDDFYFFQTLNLNTDLTALYSLECLPWSVLMERPCARRRIYWSWLELKRLEGRLLFSGSSIVLTS